MNIVEGYAAINCSDSFVTKWVGVIAGNIWCEKHRKTPDEALKDAKLMFDAHTKFQ